MLELALSISGAKDKSDGFILQGRWFRKIFVKMSVMFFLITLSKETRLCGTYWPSLKNVVSLILEANGLPVIAHPARYKLSYNLLTICLKSLFLLVEWDRSCYG